MVTYVFQWMICFYSWISSISCIHTNVSAWMIILKTPRHGRFVRHSQWSANNYSKSFMGKETRGGGHISNIVINAVPADGRAPLDPRTFVRTKMTECEACVHKGAMFEIETQTRWVTKNTIMAFDNTPCRLQYNPPRMYEWNKCGIDMSVSPLLSMGTTPMPAITGTSMLIS